LSNPSSYRVVRADVDVSVAQATRAILDHMPSYDHPAEHALANMSGATKSINEMLDDRSMNFGDGETCSSKMALAVAEPHPPLGRRRGRRCVASSVFESTTIVHGGVIAQRASRVVPRQTGFWGSAVAVLP